MLLTFLFIYFELLEMFLHVFMLNISFLETVLGIWNITLIFFIFSQYFIPKKERRRTHNTRFASLGHLVFLIKNVDIDDLAGAVTETPSMRLDLGPCGLGRSQPSFLGWSEPSSCLVAGLGWTQFLV